MIIEFRDVSEFRKVMEIMQSAMWEPHI